MWKGGRENIDADGSDDAGRDDDYCVGGIDDGGDFFQMKVKMTMDVKMMMMVMMTMIMIVVIIMVSTRVVL